MGDHTKTPKGTADSFFCARCNQCAVGRYPVGDNGYRGVGLNMVFDGGVKKVLIPRESNVAKGVHLGQLPMCLGSEYLRGCFRVLSVAVLVAECPKL